MDRTNGDTATNRSASSIPARSDRRPFGTVEIAARQFEDRTGVQTWRTEASKQPPVGLKMRKVSLTSLRSGSISAKPGELPKASRRASAQWAVCSMKNHADSGFGAPPSSTSSSERSAPIGRPPEVVTVLHDDAAATGCQLETSASPPCPTTSVSPTS